MARSPLPALRKILIAPPNLGRLRRSGSLSPKSLRKIDRICRLLRGQDLSPEAIRNAAQNLSREGWDAVAGICEDRLRARVLRAIAMLDLDSDECLVDEIVVNSLALSTARQLKPLRPPRSETLADEAYRRLAPGQQARRIRLAVARLHDDLGAFAKGTWDEFSEDMFEEYEHLAARVRLNLVVDVLRGIPSGMRGRVTSPPLDSGQEETHRQQMARLRRLLRHSLRMGVAVVHLVRSEELIAHESLEELYETRHREVVTAQLGEARGFLRPLQRVVQALPA